MSEQDKTAEEKLEEAEKKYLYLYAEFDNFKKRVDRDKESFLKYGHEPLMKDLLSVQDNFLRASSHAKDPDTKAGLEMIVTQFANVLENYGVSAIKTEDVKFDPNFHEALIEETSEKEKGTITLEVEKGYLLHNRLLRAAKVVVSK